MDVWMVGWICQGRRKGKGTVKVSKLFNVWERSAKNEYDLKAFAGKKLCSLVRVCDMPYAICHMPCSALLCSALCV